MFNTVLVARVLCMCVCSLNTSGECVYICVYLSLPSSFSLSHCGLTHTHSLSSEYFFINLQTLPAGSTYSKRVETLDRLIFLSFADEKLKSDHCAKVHTRVHRHFNGSPVHRLLCSPQPVSSRCAYTGVLSRLSQEPS